MPDELFERLVSVVILDADEAAIAAGLRPGTTPADSTRAAVRAAFRTAIHNGLVTLTAAEDWPEWVEGPPKEAD